MAQTKIDICNQALLKVGADTIASLDTNQNTNESSIRSAKLCNILLTGFRRNCKKLSLELL